MWYEKMTQKYDEKNIFIDEDTEEDKSVLAFYFELEREEDIGELQ